MAISRAKVEIWQRALDRIGHTKKIESENDTSAAAEVCRRHFDDIIGEIFEEVHWPFARVQAALSSIEEQAKTYAYSAAVSDTDFYIPYPFLSSTQVEVTKGGSELTAGTDYNVVRGDPTEGTLDKIVLTTALVAGESITITVTTSRVGWENFYALPSDCLTPIALLADGERYDLTHPSDRLEFAIVPRDGMQGLMLCTDLDSGETGDFLVLEYTANFTYVPAIPRLTVGAIVTRLEEELWRAIPKDVLKAREAHARFILDLDKARIAARRIGNPGPAPLTPSLAARR